MKVSKKIEQIKEANDKLNLLNNTQEQTLVKKLKQRIKKIKVLIEIYEDLKWLNENTPVNVVYIGVCNAYLYRLKYKSVWEGINIQCNEDFLTIGRDETDFILNPLAQLKQALIEHKVDVSTLTLTEF